MGVGKPKELGVGRRIRAWRIERGLTQEQLAKRCGLKSASNIYRYERNQVLPGVLTLVRIAEALDVPVDALVRDNPIAYPGVSDQLNRFVQQMSSVEPNLQAVALAAARAVAETAKDN